MSTIETKAASSDVKALHEDMQRLFATFRETNEERLSQIEDRLAPDVITEEKLARLDRALDETKSRLDRVTLDMSRPALAARTQDDPRRREHKAAFDTYVRAGEASGLKALEAKAMSAGSGADGGYLVPQPAEQRNPATDGQHLADPLDRDGPRNLDRRRFARRFPSPVRRRGGSRKRMRVRRPRTSRSRT